MAVKVGINGFGRIGRNIFRATMGDSEIDIVAVNDITDSECLAHLLKYDSALGTLDANVSCMKDGLVIDEKVVKVVSERDPADLPWKDLGVEVVVESTGLFRSRDLASKHLDAGAKKVIISAPAMDEDITIVLGVNHEKYSKDEHHIISNASCTTNCLAPVAKVLMDNFGIKSGLMTTIHSYTSDQNILDGPHKDLRRARSAAISMIPTTTGAAKATGLVLPELVGKLDGMAIRVPTPNVSLVDLVVDLEKKATVEDINSAMYKASEGELKGILEYIAVPLVSIDFSGNPHSSIFDSGTTMALESGLVKVLSWYDNEWGYSNRVKDLIKYIYA
ncbi:type I glyceraldehyde-3-phosphate dehydrogenase [Candidatus Poribacteria bacterium]